jgi:protoheme IX farnesyltransferase
MTTLFATSIDMAGHKTSLIGDILSLTKARLSMLVIFTSALGLFLAPGEISTLTGIVATLATSGLVAGACMINCMMEKDIDAKMERTKHRPIPAGRISPESALKMGVALIAICLIALFLIANPLTSFLGLVATVTYIFLYTPMKQRTSWALFAGAIPGAIPPLMGWTAVTNSIGLLGVVLFGILFVWQLPHFLSISIYHAKDYQNAGIKTFPTELGIRIVVHKIAFYTLILLLVSLLPFMMGEAGEGYRNTMIIVGGAFVVLSLIGFKYKEDSQDMLTWSRRYFYSSLVYLPCVFVAMLAFR